jgi:ATP-dependent Clp protease ATP-binding subunit ClpA
MLEASERLEHLRGLEAHLQKHVRGQDHLLPRVAAALVRGEMGLSSPARPRGSFLFVGPTGTGKTELALCFSDYLFGPGCVHRFDLSEYQNQSSVEKMIGADRTDAGLLGRVLAGAERGTLLFDEMEKAHPLVLDLFLQMLDAARITLATGEVKSLSGYYVVFTSNIGSPEAMRMERSSHASIETAVLRRVAQGLRPELIGRINEKLVFARLTPDVQREICGLLVAREVARLRGHGFDLDVTREAVEFLLREGFDPYLGARPLRRAVESHLQDAVVRDLFATGVGRGKVCLDSSSRWLVIYP